MLVCKFGGTSVQDAENLLRLASIIKSKQAESPIVVASAMGKTTNGLLEAAAIAAVGDSQRAVERFSLVEENHLQVAKKLNIALTEDDPIYIALQAYFKEIRYLLKGISAIKELSPRITDEVASYGERLSTLILAEVLKKEGLNSVLLDARKCIITDNNFTFARPLYPETDEAIRAIVLPEVQAGKIPVLQGFIGSTKDGVTTTLGRGGSDYSAAIFGASLNAAAIEIWTDVTGVLTTDPRMIPEAKRLPKITFDEAAELAHFGAKVLHPATIAPAKEKNIPVKVLNSYHPELEGTTITNDKELTDKPFVALSYYSDASIINIKSPRMVGALGFLQSLFAIVAKYNVAVDVVATSNISVSFTVTNKNYLNEIVAELTELGECSVSHAKSVICLVGEKLSKFSNPISEVVSILDKTKIDILSYGASDINITAVIDDADLKETVTTLHQRLFEM